MDYVDAPLSSQRQHPRGLAHEEIFQPSAYRNQPKSNFQNELGARLKARKKQGLAADLTSDDTEEDEEVNDVFSQYRVDPTKQRKDRPLSAKHRKHPQATPDISLNSTLRPGEGNKWMKQKDSTAGFHSSMPPLRTSPKDAQYNEYTRASPNDISGLSARFQSPRDSQSGGSLKSTPRDGLMNSFARQQHNEDYDNESRHKKSASPKEQSRMPSLTKTPPPIDQKAASANKAKEDLLFGRKTPTKEDKRKSPVENQANKPWQPPSFRKASPVQVEPETSTNLPSPGDHHGRRTPLQSDLGTIEEKKESPKPTPRFKQKSGDEEKPMPRFRPKSGEGEKMRSRSGDRNLSPDLQKKKKGIFNEEEKTDFVPRPKPRSNIFGKMEQVSVDISDEDTPKPRSRAQIEQQKAEAQKPNFSKTPKGRKTPESNVKQKAEDAREPFLLDFMTDTNETPKPKRRQMSPKEEKYDLTSTSPKRGLRFSDSVSRGSPEPPRRAVTMYDTVIPDDSSVCADLENEPRPKSASALEKSTSKSPTRQRSDKRAIDAAIDKVANSQTRSATMKPIQPAKNLDHSGGHLIHKPKPRHTLPGSDSVSEVSFDSTQSIRQTIYEEWRKQKNHASKQQLSEKSKLEKEQKDKEEREKLKKIEDAKLSYIAWQEQKKSSFIKKAKEKNLKDKESENEEREKAMRKKEADKVFKMWMERKSEPNIENKRKKYKERQEEKEKEEEKKNRMKESVTAFRGWKNRKDQIIQRNLMTAKELKKQKKMEEKQEAQQRDRNAVKLYDEWMTKKEEQEKKNKTMKRHSVDDDIDFRPAWRPSSSTVPFGR